MDSPWMHWLDVGQHGAIHQPEDYGWDQGLLQSREKRIGANALFIAKEKERTSKVAKGIFLQEPKRQIKQRDSKINLWNCVSYLHKASLERETPLQHTRCKLQQKRLILLRIQRSPHEDLANKVICNGTSLRPGI